MLTSRIAGGGARTMFIAAALAVVIGGAHLGAQQQTRITVTGGLDTDQRGVQSRAVAITPSVTLTSPSGNAMTFDVNASRYETEAWAMGAGAALRMRDQLGGPFAVALAADARGDRLNVAGATASFVTTDVAPSLELGIEAFTVFGGLRAAMGHLRQSPSRPPIAGSVNRTESAFGPSFGASFLSQPAPGEALRVSARNDRLFVAGVRVDDMTISAAISNAISTFSGTIGQRRASDERLSFGSAALGVNVTPTVTFTAEAGRFPSDRLTGALAGSYVYAGFAFGQIQTRRTR
jgi:hypothetical protein